MKKYLLASIAAAIGLAGGSTLASTTASAKTIKGMPSYFFHTWYRGKQKVKFTKNHVWWGTTGHKFGKSYYFKYVGNYGKSYIPRLHGDVPAYKYSNGHLYEENQQDQWLKYQR